MRRLLLVLSASLASTTTSWASTAILLEISVCDLRGHWPNLATRLCVESHVIRKGKCHEVCVDLSGLRKLEDPLPNVKKMEGVSRAILHHLQSAKMPLAYDGYFNT